MNLRNLSQEELIKIINEKDKKIEVLIEQLNWYSQQVKLQQKKLFGSSSEKTALPEQISLFDEIEVESTPIKSEPQLEEVTYKRKKKNRKRGGWIFHHCLQQYRFMILMIKAALNVEELLEK